MSFILRFATALVTVMSLASLFVLPAQSNAAVVNFTLSGTIDSPGSSQTVRIFERIEGIPAPVVAVTYTDSETGKFSTSLHSGRYVVGFYDGKQFASANGVIATADPDDTRLVPIEMNQDRDIGEIIPVSDSLVTVSGTITGLGESKEAAIWVSHENLDGGTEHEWKRATVVGDGSFSFTLPRGYYLIVAGDTGGEFASINFAPSSSQRFLSYTSLPLLLVNGDIYKDVVLDKPREYSVVVSVYAEHRDHILSMSGAVDLYDYSGNFIESKQLPEGKTEVRFSVPKPGTYTARYNDGFGFSEGIGSDYVPVAEGWGPGGHYVDVRVPDAPNVMFYCAPFDEYSRPSLVEIWRKRGSAWIHEQTTDDCWYRGFFGTFRIRIVDPSGFYPPVLYPGIEWAGAISDAPDAANIVTVGGEIDLGSVVRAPRVGEPPLTTISPSGVKHHVGDTLRAKPGVWTPTDVSLTYQWTRDGYPIPGSTSATYKLIKADQGHSVGVAVTGRREGIQRIAPVAYVDIAGKPLRYSVVIKGKIKVGASLRAKVDNIPQGAKVTVQWYRNGHKISGAKLIGYKVTKSDINKHLRVVAKISGAKIYSPISKLVPQPPKVR